MYYNMDERKLLKEKTLFYLKKHKFRIILLYIATATSNLVNLIPMYLFGHSIDYTIAGDFKKSIKHNNFNYFDISIYIYPKYN
ncbi:hypothetical protein EXQ32_16505 [Clostridium botulinum]|nr:hypothetical protein [Clostridium botulinum]